MCDKSKSGPTLSRLDDARLAEMFQQRGNDPQFLDALNAELKQRDSDAAFDLHLKVVMARRALVRSQTSAEPRRAARHRNRFTTGCMRFSARGSSRVRMNGRSIATEWRIANMNRRKRYCGAWRAPAVWLSRTNAPVLCSLRIARSGSVVSSTSTFLRWDDPAPDLFPSVPYASKQALTTFGLDYWRRPLRSSAYAREFLLTVALEGGFPVRILAEGARGWLKEYLRAIMRRAIAWRVDTPAEILAIAEEERGRMRKSYQHDDFVALCSELVTSLLELRQKAEAESRDGIRNSALLDAKHPGWRDELPIYVPAEDEALVAELLTGLLDEKMTGLTVEGVEVRRYLVKREGEWHPALQLLADGEIPPAKLPGLPATSRARAIATGELGNHLAGEVALFEPPDRRAAALAGASLICAPPGS